MLRFLPLVLLVACTELPDLDGTISPASKDAPFPELVPLDPLLATVPKGTAPPPDALLNARIAQHRARLGPLPTPVNLDARVARLKARAAWLRKQS